MTLGRSKHRPRQLESLEPRILLTADLSVRFGPTPDVVQVTDKVAYVVHVKNEGPDAVRDVQLDISYPELDQAAWTLDAFPARLNLEELDGNNGFVFDHGSALRLAGDLNADGVEDLVVATKSDSVYVIFGATNLGQFGTLDGRQLDGSNGFVIEGTGDLGSPDVEGLGDINADGIADLLINDFVLVGGHDVGISGRVDLRDSNASHGFRIATPHGSGAFAPAGDFNGDGINDLLVSDSRYPDSRYPKANPGAVWVHYGHAELGVGGVLPVGTLDADRRLLIRATGDQEVRFGQHVVRAGDVNNDGFDDILATDNGVYQELPPAYYLILGGGSSSARELNFSISPTVSHPRVTRFVSSSNRASLAGGATPTDWNNDGFDDIFFSGRIIYGGANGIGEGVEPTVSNGLSLSSLLEENGPRLPTSVRSVGDFNGDGVTDFITHGNSSPTVGIHFVSEPQGQQSVGEFQRHRVRLNGSNGVLLVTERPASLVDIQSGVDLNGDGVDDLVVADRTANRTHVVFGSQRYRHPIVPNSSLDLAAGQELTIEVAGFVRELTAEPLVSSVKIQVAAEIDPNLTNNTARSEPTAVRPRQLALAVDLSVAAHLSDGELLAGNPVEYKLRVSNKGETFANNAKFAVQFQNLSSVSWTRDDGHQGSGNMDAKLDLFAGQSYLYTIHATVGRDRSAGFEASIVPGNEQINSNVEANSVSQISEVPLRTQVPTMIGNANLCFDETMVVDDDLYFVGLAGWKSGNCFLTRRFASSGFYGGDLWKTDGTAEGTHLVKHIRPLREGEPDLFDGFRPPGDRLAPRDLQFAGLQGLLYFAVDDGVHGSELWRSDGTDAGTYLVKDINPTVKSETRFWGPSDYNQSSNIHYLQVVDEVLAFVAFDGSSEATWISDGTSAGTRKAEKLTLAPPLAPEHQFAVHYEDGQLLRVERSKGEQVLLAELDEPAHHIRVVGDKAVFNNVEPTPMGYNVLSVVDLRVDAVTALPPVLWPDDGNANPMKSFATEVIAFQGNDQEDDLSESGPRNNPFDFLGNSSGYLNFQKTNIDRLAPPPSITVGFPAAVVDGPGTDIEVKLTSPFGKGSIAVFGGKASGEVVFLANITETSAGIDLSEMEDSGPFITLTFTSQQNTGTPYLYNVEATIDAVATFAALAPNNLDLEFSWDLNHDGVFGDRMGRSVGLTQLELDSFGIGQPGKHLIAVKMDDRVMSYFDEATFVVEDQIMDSLVGDINSDGSVSIADFMILLENFQRTDARPEHGDLDGDHHVGFSDFLLLSEGWKLHTTLSRSQAVDLVFAVPPLETVRLTRV